MGKIFALATSVFLALCYQVATAQSPATLPVDQFTKYDESGGIKVSPSGEHVAYMTGKYGRSILVFISVKDKKRTGGVRCPDGFEFYDFDWVSNTRVVYRIAERQLGRAQPSVTGEMLAIDYDGKNQQFIYGYRAGQQQTGTHMRVREASIGIAEMISPYLTDDKNILIAEHPFTQRGSWWRYDPDAKPLIIKLNVFTGAKYRIDSAPLASATVMVDHSEQPRFAIGLNQQFKPAVSWKQDATGKWADFDLPGFVEDTITPRLISADNQSVFFTGVRENESLQALYSLNFATRELVKISSFENTDVTDVILDFSRTHIVGVVSYTDKPVVRWLNMNDRAARVHSALYRAFPDQSVQVKSTTQDGSKAVVFVSSDVNPGDYYLFDTRTLKAEYLQSARRWIVPGAMRSKEPFAIKARDGTELHGYVTRPNGPGPYALVVLPHGGPHGVRDYWDFDPEVQLLANRGYAVLQVNYRGSGGYGDKFEALGYKEWGENIQDDITDATRWAIEQRIAQADRICIYGASFGGYAALQGAVREPALYRCAIGFAGVYDLELMLSSADIPLFKSGRAYLQRALGDDRERLRAYSPAYNADKIQIPVLLIHGKEDWRADFDQATRMKQALENNQKKFEWMALGREGHGIYDEETKLEMYQRILEFLDKHLQTPKNLSASN